MTEHEHRFRYISADAPDPAGRRWIHLNCEDCGEKYSKLSARTDKDIAAELGVSQ